MNIAVPKESALGERRVALTPDGAKELVSKGVKVVVEAGAGAEAFYPDQAYSDAGAEIASDRKRLFADADIVLMLTGPTDAGPSDEIELMREGAAFVSFVFPTSNPKVVQRLVDRKVSAFAMDLIPRISRAQTMDALSSMSTIAGYKASLLAADYLPKFFPMLMTAAGTLPPARVFVLGAGVAGLQAIATCKRLGARIEAFDVRPAVKEQIESLGGKFIGLSELANEGVGEGGYAKELSKDTHQKELDLIASRLPQTDAVVTTALIPNRPAPILITKEMVNLMKPGSVIIDLAAPNGGNCESTVKGEVVVQNGVTIVGRTDLITGMAHDASRMYSKNMTTFLALLLDKEGNLNVDMSDEIIAGTLVTQDGKIVHEATAKALGGS